MQYLRRKLLTSSLAGSTACALGGFVPSYLRAASTLLQWLPLDDGLALVHGAGGAVVVNYGSDGTALVDGGNADASAALLQLVESRTGQTPTLLFNTHCHRDHTGCNETLGAAGATIVAHENTRLWLGIEYISKWENVTYAPLPAVALPDRTFHYDIQNLRFNEAIEYAILPQAHTDGDIYVFFPDRNLVVAGDVVAAGRYPVLDYCTNGWIGGMIGGLNTLLGFIDDATRIIAGDGSELRRADLQDQLVMLMAVIDRIGTHYYQGGSLAEFLASKPTAEFDARRGDPALFLTTAWESVFWGHIGDVRRFRA